MTHSIKRRRALAGLVAALAIAAAAGCEKVMDLAPLNPFKREINILVWNAYFDKEIYADFEKLTGIHVNAQIFVSNPQLEEILEKNPGKYDLAMPSSFEAKRLLFKGNMLSPFNRDSIRNLSHVDKKTYNAPFDPDNHFVIPYIWGSTGIAYNADDVDALPKSWKRLFDKTETPRRIALLDDSRFTLGCALLYLGYSPATTNRSEVVAAGNVIKDIAGNIAYLDNDNIPELLSKHLVDMAMAWSGDVTVAMLGNKAQRVHKNLNVRIALPIEGTIVFRDCFVMPAGSRHQAAAEIFLNYLLDPRVAGHVTNYSYYATTLKDSTPYVRRAIVNSASYYIHPYPAMNHFIEENTPETDAIYNEVWNDVKSVVKAKAYVPPPQDSAEDDDNDYD